jgi:hypothetical protein
MVVFGIDTHKRTHTVVAVDAHAASSLSKHSAPPAPIISSC